ncbi:MAG: MFS transporter [Gammaproteobacteria bacterium]
MQADRPTSWPTPRQAHYSLFVLTVVVMFTVLDRQILALMIEPLKADFGISDTQAALLLGAAFSLTYAIAGLPIARLADRMNRRNLVAICLAFWSAATMACGIAQSYTALLLAAHGHRHRRIRIRARILVDRQRFLPARESGLRHRHAGHRGDGGNRDGDVPWRRGPGAGPGVSADRVAVRRE